MKTILRETGSVSVASGISRNSEAFMRLMKLCRPVAGINEKAELAAWRREKFGGESAD